MNEVEKFKLERSQRIKKLGRSALLRLAAKKFLHTLLKNKYDYNWSWLGRPIIQIPSDVQALQEIIWETKPDLIIETGIAHGGSLIFSASMLELLGNGEVVGIDVDIRKHNRKEIENHSMMKRITMIEGSSTDPGVLAVVAKIVKKHKRVMVCLDSLHSHDHVLKELELYSPFVTKGNYIVAMDTEIELWPKGFYKNRPWDKGNNPATAARSFLKNHKNFTVDKDIDAKLLISSSPGGYIKRVR